MNPVHFGMEDNILGNLKKKNYITTGAVKDKFRIKNYLDQAEK